MQGCSRNPGAPLALLSPGVLSKAGAGVCVPVCAHTRVCLSVCVCAFSGGGGESLWQELCLPTGRISERLICKMEEESSPACWAHGVPRCLPSFSLLSGPAHDHASLTAAVGPAVFNGKDSPKHQLLVKHSLSAAPRPSALGSLACPVRGLTLLWVKTVAGREDGGAPVPRPPSLLELGGLEGESGQVIRCLLSPWGCAQALAPGGALASAPDLGGGCVCPAQWEPRMGG